MLRLILICAFLHLTINISHGQQLSTTRTDSIGAVYTTSARLKNQVIVNRLDADGTLTVVRLVNTKGVGINTTDIDPLFSQGRVVVHSNYLFVINPGSSSLSMFLINPCDATDLILLSVKQVYGSFPVSVAVNSMYACVLTGGRTTGIRCFTYDETGLSVVLSFDRNLTRYISQTEPPTIPLDTMSEIRFSADNRALIISVKGNPTQTGYLLFFLLSHDNTKLTTNPVLQRPINAVLPFSMTLVGRNGLLVTDPGRNLVLTMTYSSRTGEINNSQSALINASLAFPICWSTYSPRTGNYYIVSTRPAAVVELELDLRSTSYPVKIVRYYLLPADDIGLDAVVVSLSDSDYLYVVAARHDIIVGFKLMGAGNAILIGRFVQQGENIRSPLNNFSNADGDATEKPNRWRNNSLYANPFPSKTGPIIPLPDFTSPRTRPVLTGLDVFLQRAPNKQY